MSGVRIDTVKLDKLIASAPERSAEIVKRGAYAVDAQMKSRAPVDTGALKSSIGEEAKSPLLYWVGDGVEYGIYNELGTYRMAPHPFAGPAAEAVRPQYIKSWSRLVGSGGVE